MLDFVKRKPEEMGVCSLWIKKFLDRLEGCDLPLHSMILMKDDAIIAETYYAPYQADTMHRMFSITKSLVSVAIGLLEEEGKLSLEDYIVDHFPEKITGEVPDYLKDLKIRDMLMMSTCHASTTYKKPGCVDWVGSFFTTPPSHVAGTTFSYDTSSTHTLCALVEKITGMKMLDYLRVKFLDDIGFSKEAYVMEAPQGESLGGSGLVATPMDLLKFMYVVSKMGRVGDKQYLPEEYMKQATGWQTDTYAKSATWEEMQGYGYQFWMTTHGGVACYGMGGQYAIYYPEKNIILVTTADTQARQGGTQLIYDAFYQEIYDRIGRDDIAEISEKEEQDFTEYLKNRKIFHIQGDAASDMLDQINETRYEMDENDLGFRWISLSIGKYEGTFDYETKEGVFSLPFGIGYNQVMEFPGYGYKTAASGAFRRKDTFLIKAHIVDESVGSVSIQLVFKDQNVTLMMRKFEETMFNEFNGIISGHRQ